MTEAPGGDGLARALALCALGYSATARERLLPLLPEELATQVSDWLRRPEALMEGATSTHEEALLARYDAVDEPELGEEEDEPAPSIEKPATRLPEVLVAVLLASAPAGEGAVLLSELPLDMQGEVTALLAISTPLSILRGLTTQERPLVERLRQRLSDEAWGAGDLCHAARHAASASGPVSDGRHRRRCGGDHPEPPVRLRRSDPPAHPGTTTFAGSS